MISQVFLILPSNQG